MKISNRIHQLKIDFEISIGSGKKIPRFVNVVLVLGEKLILIDSGVKGSEKKIFDYIREQGRDPSEIELLILSHAHPDHMGAAGEIKELTGCRVAAHKNEKSWIENIELQNMERPVPGFFTLTDRNVKVDEFLEEGQEINVMEGLTMRILLSPGHSKGLLNILFIEDRILFTGDAIPLKNDIPNYDNFYDLKKSLEAIKNHREYSTLLTSWTAALRKKEEIDEVLREAGDYLDNIDTVVKDCYYQDSNEFPDSCKMAVEKLGLPPFLNNPVVDRAFKSHLKNM